LLPDYKKSPTTSSCDAISCSKFTEDSKSKVYIVTRYSYIQTAIRHGVVSWGVEILKTKKS
jgi:hypothetical protein